METQCLLGEFFYQMIFFENRVFYECLLITWRIVIKKSICMISFHVVQQGYTVRLIQAAFLFRKSICSAACTSQPLPQSLPVVHTVTPVSAPSHSASFRRPQAQWPDFRGIAEACNNKKKEFFFHFVMS